MKDAKLATLTIAKQTYSIRATAHAMERMSERNVSAYVVTSNVLALGPEKLLDLQSKHEEAIVIDELHNCAVVIAFKGNTVKVVTVINKSNVFVKSNTRIERL